MNSKKYLLLAALSFISVTFAQETKGFETDLNAGFTLTRGNSETSRLTLGAASKRIKEKHEFLLSASYDYGQTTTSNADGIETETTNMDRAKAEAQSNWLFSEKTYSFFNLTLEKDEITKIDYRVTTGPGLGYYFLRNDMYLLSTESSLVYVIEELQQESDEYAAFRFAQKFERTFDNGARIWQSLELVANLSESEDYTLYSELGAKASLTGALSLRVVLQNKYNNDPEPDVENNDLTILSGISVRI